MNHNTGSVIPPNLIADRFVFFTADNIGILDETLDGKYTFHATQVAAWQRGPASDIPVAMSKVSSAPVFQGPIEREWFTTKKIIRNL
ncbi:hypothetical protein SNE40_018093 [Patella caerulea]